MADDFKIISRDDPANGAVDIVSQAVRPAFELSPREPHLYDYLLVLRKHQWLILSFMLAVVTIVSIATFRMQPVYVATARIELGRENANILPFQGTDSYDYMLDLENYIETQSKILTSETLALQTIRTGVLTGQPQFQDSDPSSEALATGSLANQKRPPELAAFLGSLGVKRVPNSRLMDISFEAISPELAAQVVNAHIRDYIDQNRRSHYDLADGSARRAQDQGQDLRGRPPRLRAEKPDLGSGRQAKHDHPALVGDQPSAHRSPGRADEETIAVRIRQTRRCRPGSSDPRQRQRAGIAAQARRIERAIHRSDQSVRS